MRTLLARFADSGLRVKDFCVQNSLSVWQFQYWRDKFGLNFRKRRKQTHTETISPRTDTPFVQVALTGGLNQPQPWHGFEMLLPNGIVFRGTESLALKSLERIRMWRR
jgi:hypothetical protein